LFKNKYKFNELSYWATDCTDITDMKPVMPYFSATNQIIDIIFKQKVSKPVLFICVIRAIRGKTNLIAQKCINSH